MGDTLTIAALAGNGEAIIQYAMASKNIVHQPVVAVQTLAMEAYMVTQDRVRQALVSLITPELREALEMYRLINGDRDTSETPDDWESGLDDVVEKMVEPYDDILTVNWCGRNTIDVNLETDEDVMRWIASFATEGWLVLTHDAEEGKPMTTQAVLDAVGLTRPYIEEALTRRPTPVVVTDEPAKENIMSDIYTAINRSIAKIGTPVPVDIGNILDNACDSDTGLAYSGFQMLGLDWNADYHSVRRFVEANPADYLDKLVALYRAGPYNGAGEELPIEEAGETEEEREAREMAELMGEEAPSAPQKAPPAASVPLYTPNVPAASLKAPTVAPAGTIVASGEKVAAVLADIKKALSVKDDDLAAIMGVSRATLNNIVNGKGNPSMDDPTRERLRSFVGERTEALEAALHRLYQ